jgi:hypothetical protein
MATSFSEDYTLPDAELFKTRFPAFDNLSDGLVDMLIDEMSDHVDNRWRDKDYQPAILYLVAHRLTLEGEPQRSDAAAVASGGSATSIAQIKKVKVDDTETEFFSDADAAVASGSVSLDATALRNIQGDALDFSLTPYGRRFIQLRRRNHGGPRVFVP